MEVEASVFDFQVHADVFCCSASFHRVYYKIRFKDTEKVYCPYDGTELEVVKE